MSSWRLVTETKSLRIGNPLVDTTDIGPICTLGQIDVFERELATARAEGGKVLCGGKRPAGLKGQYFEPTIIDCPARDMRIVDTELFGPVLCVLRFKDEADAIRLANDTMHGLAAGIFTTNGARALRVAKAVRAGIVWVNSYRMVSPIAEFGGLKGSGYGRESGYQAVYDYTRPKTVWINTSEKSLPRQFTPR